jgi:hypothetical protein
VTTVINLPPSLDDKQFESVFAQLAKAPVDARVGIAVRAHRAAHRRPVPAREAGVDGA